MPAEVPHCIDCGTALKAVPTWMATAKVSFTCGACPRRSARGGVATAPRLERPLEARSASSEDAVPEVEDIEDTDEDADLDLPVDEIDDEKEDVDV